MSVSGQFTGARYPKHPPEQNLPPGRFQTGRRGGVWLCYRRAHLAGSDADVPCPPTQRRSQGSRRRAAPSLAPTLWVQRRGVRRCRLHPSQHPERARGSGSTAAGEDAHGAERRDTAVPPPGFQPIFFLFPKRVL